MRAALARCMHRVPGRAWIVGYSTRTQATAFNTRVSASTHTQKQQGEIVSMFHWQAPTRWFRAAFVRAGMKQQQQAVKITKASLAAAPLTGPRCITIALFHPCACAVA
jgi:hypothetical protein